MSPGVFHAQPNRVHLTKHLTLELRASESNKYDIAPANSFQSQAAELRGLEPANAVRP